MQDETTTDAPPGRRRASLAIGMLAAGAVAGAVLAGTLSASAASSTTSSSTTGSGAYGAAQGSGGNHSSSPVRGDEKALSSSDAAKVKAAALKAVSGSTVYRIETDAGDGVYEAHMTKADGTEVTVKVNKNFTVTAVEDGMGKGDPRPSGQQGGTGGGSSGPTGAA